MKNVNILGVKVSDISRAEALARVKNFVEDHYQHYITTPNPEIVLKSLKDANLRLILNSADLALPDGFGLKIAARLLGQKLNHRVAGADFAEAIVPLAQEEGWGVFLLGSKSEKIAEQAAWGLRYKYKKAKIVGHASGGVVEFKQGRWQASDEKLIHKINLSGAKILFVGFGCPRQEKWIFQNLDKMPSVKLAITVGGTIDFFAGRRKRALALIRRAGLEWLWRLVQEPRARMERIWKATAVFIWTTVKWRFRMAFVYRKNVAGFIVNNKTQVFLIKRADTKKSHWQMPQGGLDDGEDPEQAIIREVQEETGIKNVKIIGSHPNYNTYDYPTKWHKLNNGYKGQRQIIFYLKYHGDNSDVNLDQREACDYLWVHIDDVVNTVYEKRKQMANMAIEGYKSL